MQAYGKLLEGVVKSVEEFASENVTPNQARDYLRNKFPETFDVQTTGNKPRLVAKESAPDDAMAKVKKELGYDGDPDVDDEEGEAALLQKAKVEMARSKQQLLATMVLLGINRIVVTDGLINAKVVFDVRASDTATRTAKASMYDQKDTERQFGDSGGWFSSDYDNTTETHKTVVSSGVDDTSEGATEPSSRRSGELKRDLSAEQMASAAGAIGQSAGGEMTTAASVAAPATTINRPCASGLALFADGGRWPWAGRHRPAALHSGALVGSQIRVVATSTGREIELAGCTVCRGAADAVTGTWLAR